MTRDTTSGRWYDLMVFWCRVLKIEPLPRLRIVPAASIPGCDALTEYYQAVEYGWRINIRRGRHKCPSLTMCHELLHVKTGCTDAIHEPWIRDVAAALNGYSRYA
jgi:hypothetical protein